MVLHKKLFTGTIIEIYLVVLTNYKPLCNTNKLNA